MDISKYISEMREKKGVTQSEMGTALGVSEKVISKWECGETKPNIELLPTLADYFEVSIDEMFGHKHNLKQDIRDFAYEYMCNIKSSDAVKEIQDICSYLILGAGTRYSKDGGWYTPEVMDEIIEEGRAFIKEKDYRPQIFSSEPHEQEHDYIRNIDNDELKMLSLQIFEGDAFIRLLDKKDVYIHLFEDLSKPDHYKIMKLIYSSDVPKKITAEYVSEKTGADIDTVTYFIEKYASHRKSTAIIEGKEIEIYDTAHDPDLQAVIAAAYFECKSWGGSR